MRRIKGEELLAFVAELFSQTMEQGKIGKLIRHADG
jgi:hypothetical protein